VPKTMLYC